MQKPKIEALFDFIKSAFVNFIQNEDEQEQTYPQVEEQSDWREQIANWNKNQENIWRGQGTWREQLDAWNELQQNRETLHDFADFDEDYGS